MLIDYLTKVVNDEASDLFIIAGSPVCEKTEGHLCPISENKLMPSDTLEFVTECYNLAGRSMQHIR